jgi:hypothetical protein
MSGFQPTTVLLKSAGTDTDYKKFDSMVNKVQIGKNTQVASTSMFNTPAASVSGFQSGPRRSLEEILMVSAGVISVCLIVGISAKNL